MSELQKLDGRTKAARERKRVVDVGSEATLAKPLSDPWKQGEIDRAAQSVVNAHQTRNGVQRKLVGGSSAVDATVLAQWNGVLSERLAALKALAPKHPLIVTAGIFAN